MHRLLDIIRGFRFQNDLNPLLELEIDEFISSFEQPCYGVPRHKDWSKERDWFIKNVQSCCQICGTKKDLTVHHIKPYHLYPELELEQSNFITVCERTFVNCHFSNCHFFDWKAYNPNIIKDAKLLRRKILKRLYK